MVDEIINDKSPGRIQIKWEKRLSAKVAPIHFAYHRDINRHFFILNVQNKLEALDAIKINSTLTKRFRLKILINTPRNSIHVSRNVCSIN